MTTRTIRQTVFFHHPFQIKGYSRTLPAGTYVVDFEEEQLDSFSRLVFRRTQASLQLPADPRQPGISETLEFDPSELDAALMNDIRSSDGERHSPTTVAIDRAENEGLSIESPEHEASRTANARFH